MDPVIATKKSSFDFEAACTRMLMMAGAKENGTSFAKLGLETIAGPMDCSPYEDWLACRFVDVEKAKQVIGAGSLNPFSGKWNWHYTKPTPRDLIGLQSVIARVAAITDEVKQIVDNYETGCKELHAPSDTRVHYQYRDADNYKVARDVCFRGGRFRSDILKALLLAMDRTLGPPVFIPGLVGLDDLQDSFVGAENQWDPERDSPWHELLSIEPVPAGSGERYADGEFTEFVERVQTQGLVNGWNESYRPSFYPVMAAHYEQAQKNADLNISPASGC